MIKAKFDAKQPELAMYREGNSMRYMIAENGKQYTEKDSEGNETKGWEYDFNEFVEPISVLEPEKVKESPSNYLGYIPTGRKKVYKAVPKKAHLNREFPTLRIWRQHFMEAKHERND